MGIYPAWINVIPSEYPILIYPTSPVNQVEYPELPQGITAISFTENGNILINVQGVEGVRYG